MTEQEKKEFIETCKKLKLMCEIRLIFNRYLPITIIGVIIFIEILKATGIYQ